MSGTGHLVLSLLILEVTLCEDGVGWTFLPLACETLTAEDDLAVTILRTVLGSHEIIVFAYAVEMRAFDTFGVLDTMAAGCQFPRLSLDAVAAPVELVHVYGCLPGIFGASERLGVVDDIRLAVLVEEERRVHATVFHVYRLAPSFLRVFALDVEHVVFRHVHRRHIVSLVLGVIAYLRGIDTTVVDCGGRQIEL